MFHYLGNIEYTQLYLTSIYFKFSEKNGHMIIMHCIQNAFYINLNAKKIVVIFEWFYVEAILTL